MLLLFYHPKEIVKLSPLVNNGATNEYHEMEHRTYQLAKLLAVSGILCIPIVASAVGLAVRPSELNLAVNVRGETKTTLTVKNPSREVALIEVYPDELEKIVEVLPTSFVLESGEEQRILITVRPQDAGVFRTNMSVVANPLSPSGFHASGGVKIPLIIQASSEHSSMPLLAAAWLFRGRHPVFNRFLLLYAVIALAFLGFRYWQLHRDRRMVIKIPGDGSFQ